MFEQLLKLYTMYMATGVTSPMPHFVGPPGSGKSTMCQQLADLVGVQLHVVNVSRINPLGLEGLEMPNSETNQLELMISEMWTRLNEGDILLFDEFLRGFPEVYNGLLDIFTSRRVRHHDLPNVFIIGASNSVATYDAALEDRLLHIPVTDLRNSMTQRRHLATRIVEELGLLPEMAGSPEMFDLIDKEVLPTYQILDSFKSRGRDAKNTIEGSSVRKLIGQAKLRFIESLPLKELLAENNRQAIQQKKFQYLFLYSESNPGPGVEEGLRAIRNSTKLTPLQKQNVELSLQLIEMGKAKLENN